MNVTSYSKSTMIKWIFTLGLPFLVALIPVNEVLTWQLKWFFVSTLFAVLCWALEVLPMVTVAILLPLFWVFFGIADPAVAFAPWTQYTTWMMLSGLIMAVILQRTGLLKRIAYKCILLTGATYNGIIIGLAIVSFLTTLLITNVQVPLATLTFGICMALGTGKSKASCGIMMSTMIVSLTTLTLSFNGAVALPTAVGASVTGDPSLLGFFESIYYNLPTLLLMIVLVFITAKLFRPETPIEGKQYFSEKLNEMGKLTTDEIKCAIVLIIYFIFLLTAEKLGLNLNWGLSFVPMLLCMPGIGPVTADDVKNVNFGFIFFIAACIGIGSVGVSLGIGQILSEIILPLVQGRNYIVFFVIAWFALFIMNFVMTPFAIEAAFTVPLTSIGMSLGLNPHVIYYFIGCTVDQIILPYEYALYLLPFSFGLIAMKDFIKLMSVKTVLAFVVMFTLLIPWWNFTGFLF